MPLAYDGHKVSAHHKFANGTYFISSALVLKFSAFFQKHCKFSLSWESYLSLKHFRKGQGSSSRNRLINCILYRVIHLRLSKKANVSPSKSILCCSEIQRVNRFDRVIYFLKVFLSLFPYCTWFSAVCLQSSKSLQGFQNS